MKSALETHISGLMHDEDSSGYDSLLQEQTDYIREFIESLGEFDSSTLAGNIVFLAKKHGMRVGELEDIIGVSAGYLSRTIKENSKKKISVDIVWKIARLFGTDIKTLTEKELWISRSNTDLLERFLERLYNDTKDNFFSWEYDGGVMVMLKDRYTEMGLVTEEDDETPVYHPNHLNQDPLSALTRKRISLLSHINSLTKTSLPGLTLSLSGRTMADGVGKRCFIQAMTRSAHCRTVRNDYMI